MKKANPFAKKPKSVDELRAMAKSLRKAPVNEELEEGEAAEPMETPSRAPASVPKKKATRAPAGLPAGMKSKMAC